MERDKKKRRRNFSYEKVVSPSSEQKNLGCCNSKIMFSIKAEPRRTEVPCNLSKHPSCRYYIAKGRERKRGKIERECEKGKKIVRER